MRVGNSEPRTTENGAYNDLINCFEQELRKIPGVTIKSHEYEILRWQTIVFGRCRTIDYAHQDREHQNSCRQSCLVLTAFTGTSWPSCICSKEHRFI